MALNEIGIHFYEKEIDRLLDSENREIIIGKFVDLQSTIDDLYVELQDRARRISELESELQVKSNANEAMKCLLEEQRKRIFALESEKEEIPEELRSKDLNFNIVSKMLDVIELMLTDTQS